MPDIFVDNDTNEQKPAHNASQNDAGENTHEHKNAPQQQEAVPQPPPPAKPAPQEQHSSTQPPSHSPPPTNHAIESVDKLLHTKDQSIKMFTAYAMHPKGITFANQEPDEVILLFLRRHFITNIPWILTTFFLFLLPPILIGGLSLIPTFVLPIGLTVVLTGFYYLIGIGYAFGKFISWFYNIGIITQKRIVDLDSANILAHNTATANFNEIVDVKFIQKGFFQSTFDYGDVDIQTEALRANFEFDAAPHPTQVVDIISDLRVAQVKGGHPHGNS